MDVCMDGWIDGWIKLLIYGHKGKYKKMKKRLFGTQQDWKELGKQADDREKRRERPLEKKKNCTNFNN